MGCRLPRREDPGTVRLPSSPGITISVSMPGREGEEVTQEDSRVGRGSVGVARRQCHRTEWLLRRKRYIRIPRWSLGRVVRLAKIPLAAVRRPEETTPACRGVQHNSPGPRMAKATSKSTTSSGV